MAYRIIDRAIVNYQPSVYTTAGYPGINTSGGDINIVNNIAQVFNLFSGTTNTTIGALPAPKIVLTDKVLIENGGTGYTVDYFDRSTNDIGGQMEFIKSVCINTNDFTQEFLDNNYVYLEMLIYKRRNQRGLFSYILSNTAWGANTAGELGDATTTSSTIPVNVQSGNLWEKVSAGYTYSLFIDGSKDTWGVGSNIHGMLGDGSNFDTTFVTPVNGGHKFKELSGRFLHNLGIDANNDIWSWGYNNEGQLGIGNTTNQNEPIKVTASTTFQKVSAGVDHSLALDVSGNIWGWGNNSSGQLGLGILSATTSPIQLTALTTSFTDISAGNGFSLLLDINGNIWASGANNNGQLGLGNTTNKNVFTQVTGLTTTFTNISAGGGNQSLLIDQDGLVWSCGNNANGQLGNNTNTSATTFSQIFGGIRFKKIDSSLSGSLSGGLDIENQLWFWGLNTWGQFGNGTSGNESNVPILLNNTNQYINFSIGGWHVLAISRSKNSAPYERYNRSAYIIPSPHYVTNNYQYPIWGQSFWTRSGAHYIYDGSTNLLMNIDRPNHRRVEKINELMDVTDYYNGRFIEKNIEYRPTSGGTSSYSTLIPYESGALRSGIKVSNRYSYAPDYCSMYTAFRYVIYDSTANQGRGQIFTSPISKIVRISHQYQPFIDDYNANAIIGLPTAYINPNHDKYKFLPRIETKLP